MIIYLQFLLAFILLVILTRWLIRKTDPDFGTGSIALALGFKVLMGCLYGYVFLKNYNGDDTWVLNTESMNELQKLLHRPAYFFEDLNIYRQIGDFGFPEGLKIFLNKLEQAMIIKPLAFFNLYSGGNYYINVVAFSGITFWGHFWLYQLIKKIWPRSRKWVFVLLFLYPPVVFWLSGIRPDGILFLFFSLLLYQFHAWMQAGRFSALVTSILAIGGMVVIRPSMAWLILPGLLAWWLVQRQKKSPKKAFFLVYGCGILFFFASSLLGGTSDLPGKVVNKQKEFLSLQGKTRLSLETLRAHPMSFVKILPQAVANTTLLPYPWKAKGMLQYLTVIQNYFIICLFLLVIIRRYPGHRYLSGQPLVWLLLLYSISVYLSIGYTIPFPGAIIRYRVIPETCLLLILAFAAGGKELSNYKYFNVYKIREI